MYGCYFPAAHIEPAKLLNLKSPVKQKVEIKSIDHPARIHRNYFSTLSSNFYIEVTRIDKMEEFECD